MVALKLLIFNLPASESYSNSGPYFWLLFQKVYSGILYLYMKDSLKERYDKMYMSNTDATRHSNPISVVRKIPSFLSEGSVLDVGAGQGRNSIFLAQNGFSVRAVDISTVGLHQLQQRADTEELSVITECKDIREGILDFESYNVIVLSFILQIFSAPEAIEFIKSLKLKASAGTFHAVAVFTSVGDFYDNPTRKKYFYPNLGELREIYKDWIIHDYTEKDSVMYKKKEDGASMKNTNALILAQAINV